MTNQRLPYSDAASLPEMAVDAHHVERNMHLPRRVDSSGSGLLDGPAGIAGARPRSRYDVPDDLAELAEGLELHFD